MEEIEELEELENFENLNELEKLENSEVFDEGKDFLDKVKKIVESGKRCGKNVVYYTDDLLILSIEDGIHTVYEVYDKDNSFVSKLVYIGDAKVKASYLLNLINKQEMKHGPYRERNI